MKMTNVFWYQRNESTITVVAWNPMKKMNVQILCSKAYMYELIRSRINNAWRRVKIMKKCNAKLFSDESKLNPFRAWIEIFLLEKKWHVIFFNINLKNNVFLRIDIYFPNSTAVYFYWYFAMSFVVIAASFNLWRSFYCAMTYSIRYHISDIQDV